MELQDTFKDLMRLPETPEDLIGLAKTSEGFMGLQDFWRSDATSEYLAGSQKTSQDLTAKVFAVISLLVLLKKSWFLQRIEKKTTIMYAHISFFPSYGWYNGQHFFIFEYVLTHHYSKVSLNSFVSLIFWWNETFISFLLKIIETLK